MSANKKVLPAVAEHAPEETVEEELRNTELDLDCDLPEGVFRVIQCANCSTRFDVDAFDSHICNYDKYHNIIVPSKNHEESPEPPSIRLLRENQIRFRRFLKEQLKYEIKSTNTTDLHECSLCDRRFVHASGLLRHMEKHTMDQIPILTSSPDTKAPDLSVCVNCSLCSRVFYDRKAAFEHLCTHFTGNKFAETQIDICSEMTYEAYLDDSIDFLNMDRNVEDEQVDVYLKVVILSSVLQCEFCDLIFSNVSKLFVHSALHWPERPFECSACGIFFYTSKEITAHWQSECVFMRENRKISQANTKKYYVCNVCEEKFHSLDLLHEHRYTASHFFPRINKRLGVMQLPCELCNVVCELAQDCISHFEEHHDKKHNGESSFSSRKIRQYLCEICGKLYTQSSHLRQHLRLHEGAKQFECKHPGCSRKFKVRPDLNDHVRKYHTGERPYQCVTCGKRFLTGSVYYQHRLIHRNERRYECEECGKRFFRADALRNHVRIHTGEKPYGCLFCTTHFRQRGDRDKHMRARHTLLTDDQRNMMREQKKQFESSAPVVKADLTDDDPTDEDLT